MKSCIFQVLRQDFPLLCVWSSLKVWHEPLWFGACKEKKSLKIIYQTRRHVPKPARELPSVELSLVPASFYGDRNQAQEFAYYLLFPFERTKCSCQTFSLGVSFQITVTSHLYTVMGLLIRKEESQISSLKVLWRGVLLSFCIWLINLGLFR